MTPDRSPVLIIFSGLPGTGKTTISKALAVRRRAVYLRIDAIEQAMKAAGAVRIGPAGYAVANALAAANLRLGHWVVADCVNPLDESRRAWRDTAAQASAPCVHIHLICSDPAEHRRRVESRASDIAGHRVPTWGAVKRRVFKPCDDDHLRLDTATASPDELVERCNAYILETVENA